jgi:copper chaperone CopZ
MLTAGRRITRLAAAVTILGLGSNACTGETTGSSEANFSDRYLASLIGAADSHENEEVMTDYLRYEEASISQCMDEAGFDYVAAPPESIFVPFGYTGDPLTDAKRFGFGISTVDVNVQASATNPTDAILASLDTQASSAWNDQYRQCADVATQEVTDQRGVGSAAAIASDVTAAVRNDPAVRKAQEAWRTCMDERGFDAASRDDLITQMTSEYGTVPSSKLSAFQTREIAAAVADAECGEQLRSVEAESTRTHLRTISPESYAQLYP